METIIVAALVVLALAYLVRRFYRGFKADTASACADGCCGCAAAGSCAADASCAAAASGAEAGTRDGRDSNRLT